MKPLFVLLTGILVTTAVACTGSKKTMKDKNKTIIPVVRETNFNKPENTPAVTIEDWSIEGDIAALSVSYSGGCGEHTFTAHFNGNYMKSLPPKATVFLNHNNGGDNCRKLITDTLYIDLKEVRYKKEGEGSVIIGFNGTEKTLEYKYKN